MQLRKRQKLLLIIYLYAVAFISFIYVPYVQFLPNGAREFVGHHFRGKLMQVMPWGNKVIGYAVIDSHLIIAEVLAITAITIAAFMLLKSRE
jgi:threonine/homoserine efflux transporter RhtA